MRGDGVFAETIGELACDRWPCAGVDEHERGAVLLDELSQAGVDSVHTSFDITASSGDPGTPNLSRLR